MKLRLNELLIQLGKTSLWLAKETNISKRSIDEYRTNRREPSFSKGLLISDALNVDPHELIIKEENI